MNNRRLYVGILFIVWLTIVSCSDSDDDSSSATPTNTTPTSYTTFIYYKNSAGKDMLDPNTPNYFTQRKFDVSWKFDNNTVVFTRPVAKNATDANLPSDYCFTIEDNNSTWGLVKFISFDKSPYKVDTLTFVYDGTVLKQLTYNKVTFSPPSGSTSFSANIPIVITK